MKHGSHGCPRNSLGSNKKVQDHRNFLRDAWDIHHNDLAPFTGKITLYVDMLYLHVATPKY